jgi:hypothetical protein
MQEGFARWFTEKKDVDKTNPCSHLKCNPCAEEKVSPMR